MSMARSTPAQNERGSASTTERGPASLAQVASAGPMRRSVCNALTPLVTVAGRSSGEATVSTMTRMTAVGTPIR